MFPRLLTLNQSMSKMKKLDLECLRGQETLARQSTQLLHKKSRERLFQVRHSRL